MKLQAVAAVLLVFLICPKESESAPDPFFEDFLSLPGKLADEFKKVAELPAKFYKKLKDKLAVAKPPPPAEPAPEAPPPEEPAPEAPPPAEPAPEAPPPEEPAPEAPPPAEPAPEAPPPAEPAPEAPPPAEPAPEAPPPAEPAPEASAAK
ncbi:uncharacterized protein LOC129342850 isoform X18 [Eublepharis macularius]|uniref:Uncharacterized protein LOC129342850 isoform X18 n=1 Tax=Eublepharis macularius TaxID=481883 RepID=A0AA97KGG7_EUBMA|nr:uncharacterized protein LOC129342850 isoform X18 [Eublepharis macularius]